MHLVILNQADKQADNRNLKSDIELWQEKKCDENTDGTNQINPGDGSLCSYKTATGKSTSPSTSSHHLSRKPSTYTRRRLLPGIGIWEG